MNMTGKPCIGHVNLTNKSKNSSKALLVFICLMLSSIASILMNGTQSIAATLPGENLGTADNLDGDWVSATSITIQDNSTGTSPFDDDDERGNDSSPQNDIIRSFDSSSYNLKCIYDMKDNAPYSYVKNGYVGFKVIIKGWDSNGQRMNLTERNVNFNDDSLLWASTENGYEKNIYIEKVDGYDCVVLKAWRKLVATDDIPTVIPGMKEIQLSINCLQMTNGQSFQPTFYTFADHNAESDYASITGDKLTVSSKPKFNTNLVYTSQDSGYGTFNFSLGNEKALNKDAGKVKGRRISVGLITEIRNDTPDKQMRGVEIPVGDITFDIKLKSRFTPKIGTGDDDPNKTIGDRIDVTNRYTPLVWNLDNNHKSDIRSDGRHYQTGNGGSAYKYIERIPYSPILTGGDDEDDESVNGFTGNSTYGNAADYSGHQAGNTVSVTIDDSYAINMIDRYKTTLNDQNVSTPFFPWSVSGEDVEKNTKYYDPNVGIKNRAIFSCGLLSIVQPFYSNDSKHEFITDTVENCYDGDFTLKVSDVNMRVTGESGTALPHVSDNSNQIDTDDDDVYMTIHVSEPGTYNTQNQYSFYTTKGARENGTDNAGWSGNYLNGSDAALTSDRVNITTGIDVAPNVKENIPAYNQEVIKFDSTVLRPREKDNLTYGFLDSMSYNLPELNKPDKQIRFYYMAKPDGTIWADDSEMNSYSIDDLIAYQSLNACERDGRHCVAIGIEDAMQHDGNHYSRILHLIATHFDIMETNPLTNESNIGKVAQTCVSDKVWSRSALFELAKKGTSADTLDDLSDNDWVKWAQSYISSPINDGEHMSSRFGTNMIKPTYMKTPVYRKESYSPNGTMLGTHTGGSNDGDSLLVLGEKVSVQKGIAQLNGENQKSIYDLDYGQRYADYVIATKIESANTDTDSVTTVSYKDTLPQGESYIDGSMKYGGSYTEQTPDKGAVVGGIDITPTVTKNDDGTTTLCWSIPNIPLSDKKMDLLRYSVSIGNQTDYSEDVSNAQELRNTVTVQSTRDHRLPSYNTGNIASCSIKVTKLRQTSLTTKISPKINEISTPFKITSTIGNFSSGNVTQAYAVTRLPWMGDGNVLSDFHGTYSIENTADSRIQIDAEKCKTNDDIDVYITTDTKYRTGKYQGNSGLKKVEEDDIESWTPCAYNADTGYVDIPNSVDLTKISLIGVTKRQLLHDEQLKMTATLDPSGNEPGDIYGKDWSDGNNTVQDAARIAQRSILGIAWNDKNKDGIRQSTEPILSGIAVKLVDENGSIATSVDGEECTAVTDSNGGYSFENIPSGTFKVIFSSTKLKNFMVSDKHALIDNARDTTIDSDVNADMSDGYLLSARTDGISFPEIASMSSSVYSQEHVDAGFYIGKSTLTVSKLDQDGNRVQKAKLELLDSSGDSIASWTTSNGDYTTDRILTPGETYTIVESEAPEGYLKSDPIRFTVPEDGSESTVAKTMTDVKVKSGIASITVHKTVNGKSPNQRVFTFELRDGTDGNGSLIQTATNASDGTVSFRDLSISTEGEKRYTITEKNDGQKGVSYDSHICIVNIKSTIDRQTGRITPTVTYTGSTTFANAYTASSTSIPVNGMKALKCDNGTRELKDGEFSFSLYDTTDGGKRLLKTVANDATGQFSFGDITYDSVGNHTYEVEENAGNIKGITYDSSNKTFSVNVEDDGNGQLVATANGNLQDNLTFTNSYTASNTELAFSGKKKIISGDTGEKLKKDEFEFAIYDLNGNSDHNKPIQVVKNREDGTFVFDTLTYSAVGTYRYSIVELNNKLPGWKYDASEYLATVNVSDNGNGTLTAEKHIDKIINGTVTDRNIQDIVFTNSYSCESVDFTPIAIKRIDGNENHRPNDMKFTFVLKDSNGNELDRATNDANGLVSFKRISYTGVGNYTYTISEIVDKTSIGNAAITYDTTVKKLNVTVNNDGNGHLSVNAMYPDNIDIDNIDMPTQNYVHTTGSALFVNKLTYDIPNNTDVTSPSNQNGASTQSDISELMQTGIDNFCAVISLIAFILIALFVHKRRIK